METKYALVLTGSALPGYAADSVWPALAGYFRMDPAKLNDQVLVRAPLTIKESDDLGKLQTLQAGAASIGAEAEICAPDGRPALFVLLDGTARGPVPRVFVEERIEHGLWPGDLMIAEVGTNAWRPFRELSPAAAPAASAEPVAEEPDVYAAAARPAGYAPTSSADYGHNLAGSSVAEAEGETQTLPAGDAIHAGFWRRVAAIIMDGFIVGIIGWIISFVLLIGLATSGSINALIAGVFLNYAVVIVVNWLYSALQESSAAQATLAKRAMGIKVTDDQARRISFGRATGRFFGKIISGMVLYIGFMLAGWTARKQALHDMMANTFVVFGDVKPGQPLPTVRPPMPWYGWVINILFLLLVPLGILAAIAIPAYQEYVSRAQGAEALVLADGAKTAVATFYARENRCPESNSEAGLGDQRTLSGQFVSSIAIEPECRVVVTFAGSSNVNMKLRGQRVEMTGEPDGAGSLSWTCASDVVIPHCQ